MIFLQLLLLGVPQKILEDFNQELLQEYQQYFMDDSNLECLEKFQQNSRSNLNKNSHKLNSWQDPETNSEIISVKITMGEFLEESIAVTGGIAGCRPVRTTMGG